MNKVITHNDNVREKIYTYLYGCNKDHIIHHMKLVRLFEYDLKPAYLSSHHYYNCFTPYTVKHHYKHYRNSNFLDMISFRRHLLKNYKGHYLKPYHPNEYILL
jgi:hypothetical protein